MNQKNSGTRQVKNFFPWAAVFLIAACVYAVYASAFGPGFAAAPTDDSLFSLRNVLRFPERFASDPAVHIALFQTSASFMNYGSLWLSETLNIPLEVLAHALLVWMYFAMPAALLFFWRNRLGEAEKIIFFLVLTASQYYAWNLGNYPPLNRVQVPYAAYTAFPLLFWALWKIYSKAGSFSVRARAIVFLMLLSGTHIHPALGFFSLCTAGLYMAEAAAKRERRRFFETAAITLPVLVTLAVSYPLKAFFHGDYPRVPASEHFGLIFQNYHAVPWLYNAAWYKEAGSLAGLLILSLICIRKRRLRDGFAETGRTWLRFAAYFLAGSFCFGLLHFIGIFFKVPELVLIAGLRMPLFAAAALLPFIAVEISASLRAPFFLERLAAAFMLSGLTWGAPYGFDLLWIAVYAAASFEGKTARLAAIGTALFWAAVWIPGTFRPGIFQTFRPAGMMLDFIYAQTFIIYLYYYTQRIPFALLFAGTALSAAFLTGSRRPALVNAGRAVLLASMVLSLAAALFTFHGTNRGLPADLYKTQRWAEKHTDENEKFITFNDAWRAFSARAVLPAIPVRYYFYKPDRRLKDYDDRLAAFYASLGKKGFAELKTKEDFQKLGAYLGARYLVDRRVVPFQCVYHAGTVCVYDLEKPLAAKGP